ncbi:MAG TPA: MBL fold metallo-hydrolase RNA specificity domain-containing protein, partial [Luteolibacter sp.]|nr:MBL fold metallo-hydrolase RNA specificity domain-containing protein [Luteolibacter sp.]
EAVDSFSGHADHSELIDYFNRTTGPKERVWLVHGEPEAGAALQESLLKIHSGTVEVGETGAEVEF